MKKVLLIPDSFKGTMSSAKICSIMEQAIRTYYPEADVVPIPVADGGEGSVEAFITAMGGSRVDLEVSGPYGDPVPAFYGIVDGSTAVIEMAACAGLPQVGDDKRPDQTTTFGVGQLMLHAAGSGCRKIIVGLGGSATNDAGAGAAAAAGVVFRDAMGNSFVPTGGSLGAVAHIDATGLSQELRDVEIVTMCDIDNPFAGPTGAAYVFGPQKGADAALVASLDKGMRAFAAVVARDLGIDVMDMPGAGAAGGMGGGMHAFFGSELRMGIEVVLDTVGFDNLLSGADMVFTGEGKIDGQSLRGKVVIGVARRTRRKNVPLVAVVGDIGDDVEGAYAEGVSAIFSINRVAKDFKHVIARAPSDMALTMDNLMRFLRRMGI